MTISILGQYCIYVSDIERAISLWETTIGIPLVSRTELTEPRILEAILQSPHGGSRLQLAQKVDDERPIDVGNSIWKLYVNTDDCQALHDRSVEAGCESVMPPTKLDRWPVTMAYVTDPDGYLLEFVEPHAGTPPGVPDPKQVTSA